MREAPHLSRRSLAAAIPLVALRGAAAAAPTVLPAATGDDAALLDLGRRWAQAWAALRDRDRLVDDLPLDDEAALRAHDAVADRLFALEQKLLDAVMATRPRTLRGLAVKAQALARVFDIQTPGAGPIEVALDREPTELEGPTALRIALDILRLGGGDA